MAKFSILSITATPHIQVDCLWLKQHCDGIIIEYKDSRAMWPLVTVDLDKAAMLLRTQATPWFFVEAYVNKVKCNIALCTGDDNITNWDIDQYIANQQFNLGCLFGDIATTKGGTK